MKKLILLVVCIIAAFSSIPATYADQGTDGTGSAKFNDIKGHWAEKTINRMADLGIVNGVGNNAFQPDASMTKCQFAALLHKTLDLQIKYFRAPDITEVFKDVKNEDWHACKLYDLVAVGIVDDKAVFKPDSPITREEMAHYIVNAYKYKNGSISQGEFTLLDQFKDKKDISLNLESDVSEAVRLKLLQGKENNLFQPKGISTRAEVTVVMERFMNLIEKNNEF
ncbi:MAG: S-layer homology domain-containing protein [Clostridia bacterium]|nr:S-layer homology domain-containing protein [Clostridia bacterium]